MFALEGIEFLWFALTIFFAAVTVIWSLGTMWSVLHPRVTVSVLDGLWRALFLAVTTTLTVFFSTLL